MSIQCTFIMHLRRINQLPRAAVTRSVEGPRDEHVISNEVDPIGEGLSPRLSTPQIPSKETLFQAARREKTGLELGFSSCLPRLCARRHGSGY